MLFDYCFVRLRNLKCNGGTDTHARVVRVGAGEEADERDDEFAFIVDGVRFARIAIVRRTSPIFTII